MQVITFISLFLLLIISNVASGASAVVATHSPLARVLDSQNGLSQSTITSTTEDQFGRLWIGTQDGVNIVDGNTIQLLNAQTAHQHLTGKVVTSLVADSDFTLWVATTNGLDRVDTRDFRVTPVKRQQQNISGIRQLLLMGDQQLVIVVDNSLLLLEKHSGEFVEAPEFADKVISVAAATNGILVRTSAGFFQYQPGLKPVLLALPDDIRQNISQYLLAGEELWLITHDHQVYSCQQGRCQRLELPGSSTAEIQSLRLTLYQNAIYFLQNENIVVYSLVEKSFRLIAPQLPVNSYTNRSTRLSIQVLSSGDIVIGRNRGLLVVPDQYRGITSYPQFNPVTGKGIYALIPITDPAAPRDKLLIATEEALELYEFVDRSPRLVTQIQYPKKLIPGLLHQVNNTLLFATIKGGVYRVDLAAGTLTLWQPDIPAVAARLTLIDVLALDERKSLLLFSRQLVLIEQQADRYQLLWSVDLPTSDTAAITYVNQQLVIAAYQKGLFKSHWTDWDLPPEHWQVFAAGNPVLDLRATTDGQLHMLTAEKGVQLLQVSAGGVSIEDLSSKQPLLNSTAVCSVELPGGDWVAATHDGLALYNKNNQLRRHLTGYDGLVQREFNQFQCGRLNDQAYFAGDQGLDLLRNVAVTDTETAKLQFTQLLVDGHSSALTDNPISLTEPNTMVLNYSYAPYPVLAPVRFQYRLEPGNEQWLETTATNLRYTQLSPNRYTLQLRAISFNGVVSETISLNVLIKPLFWRSPQAYVLYSLSLIFILWLFFRQRWLIQDAQLQVAANQHQFQIEYTDKLEEAVRLRTVKLEQQQQEFLLLQQEKIEFLTTTSHDLKNLSALVQLHLAELNKYLLPTGQDSFDNVHASCKLLNTLVDDILELSKLNAGVVTPTLQPVHLPQLLQQLFLQFKLMADERQIDFELNIEQELVVLTDPHLLSRLLLNLIDNALKNLSAGHTLQLELKKRYRASRQVYLLVRDSGPGMPEHMRRHWGLAFQRGVSGYQGSGLGLSIVKKIAELLVLPVSLYSSDRGTCFELRFQQSELQQPQSAAAKGLAAIIESDPQARQFLYYELVRRGFQVVVFNNARDFARSGQRGFEVLISDIHFNATDDTIADLALFRSSLDPQGKLIFVSADASVRQRLPDDALLYFMLKPVKRSRLAWLLAKEP